MAERERVDPATNAARALATCIAAYRDLLNDAGFAAVLPAFEQLRVTLPNAEAVTVPGPRQARQDEPIRDQWTVR